MKIVDLTHTMSSDMPVYPGSEQPEFVAEGSIADTGFLEKKLIMSSHLGTHVDAPAHLLSDAETLDVLAIENFYGSALMVNIETLPAKTIDISDLEFYTRELEKIDFLILHTGWSGYWGTAEYFSNYPVVSTEAANWLATFQLKGVGFDTISADTADSRDYPIHKILLQRNIILIENLANLSFLAVSRFAFSCFPLKLKDADGSPVRAVAYI